MLSSIILFWLFCALRKLVGEIDSCGYGWICKLNIQHEKNPKKWETLKVQLPILDYSDSTTTIIEINLKWNVIVLTKRVFQNKRVNHDQFMIIEAF